MRFARYIVTFFVSLIVFVFLSVAVVIAFLIKNVLLNPKGLLLLSAAVVLLVVASFIVDRIRARR